MRKVLFFASCWLLLSMFGPVPGASAAEVLNPIGRPTQLSEKGQAGYFVWCEKGIWHLRTRRVDRRALFAGTIQIIGGKVTDCWAETADRRQPADKGWVNSARTIIKFTLGTHPGRKGYEGRDGFAFTVSDSAQEIRFTLSRYDKRSVVGPKVRIGARNQPPSRQYEIARQKGVVAASANFALPAHPKRPQRAF